MSVGLVTARRPLGVCAERAHAAFRGEPGAWLPAPARLRGPDRWTVTLQAGPVSRSVVCTVGPLWEVDGVAWRRLGWQPEPERGDPLPVERLLPVLAGELGLAEESGQSVLVLDGTYDPPVGLLGTVGDWLLGRRVARATARAFLAATAFRLEAAARTPAAPG